MVTKLKIKVYQDFARRLHQACDEQNITKERGRATTLSRLLNNEVGYKGVSKWLDGNSMPDMAHGSQLAAQINVRFEWLMTGRGPMRNDRHLDAREGSGVYLALPDPALRVARNWQSLPPNIKSAIEQLLDAMTDHYVKKRKGD